MRQNLTPACLFAQFLVISVSSLPAAEITRTESESADRFRARIDRELKRELPGPARAALHRVIHAYPDEITGVRADRKRIDLMMRGGATVPFEDFEKKNYEQRIENADVADMLHDAYPAELKMKTWPESLDPGRYRNDAFLQAVYGNSPAAVGGNLDTIDFFGSRVSFNRKNGAAAALRKVAAELAVHQKADPKRFDPYLKTLGGGYNWRKIAGTDRLSAHSYGISIDLNPDLGGYWRWNGGKGLSDMKRRVDYPPEIVTAFERNGFIWGGKWYHFDLMHFEYRPELLNDVGRRFPGIAVTTPAEPAAPPKDSSTSDPRKPPAIPPPPIEGAGAPSHPKDRPLIAKPVNGVGPPMPKTEVPAATAKAAARTDRIRRFEIPDSGSEATFRVESTDESPPQWIVTREPGAGVAGTEILKATSLLGLIVRDDLGIPEPVRRQIEARFIFSQRDRVKLEGGSLESFDSEHFDKPLEAQKDPGLRRFYEDLRKVVAGKR